MKRRKPNGHKNRNKRRRRNEKQKQNGGERGCKSLLKFSTGLRKDEFSCVCRRNYNLPESAGQCSRAKVKRLQVTDLFISI